MNARKAKSLRREAREAAIQHPNFNARTLYQQAKREYTLSSHVEKAKFSIFT